MKGCSTCNCTVQAMLKAVDDANRCAKSRLIVVLKVLRSPTSGVTRVTVFLWYNCYKVRHRFGEGDCFVMAWKAAAEAKAVVKATV